MAFDRRSFLKLGGVGIAGIAFAPLLNGCEEFTVTPLNDGVGTTFVTPSDLFFVQNGGQGSISGWTRPSLNEATWGLTIEGFQPGDVATPLVVTYADILEAARSGAEVTILKTIQCVLESPLRLTPTGFMGNAYWTGVPLKYFLDRAGIASSVKKLLFFGADGFTNNITMARVTDAESLGLAQPLLAYRMNGAPLTPDHGYPVRLLIQEGYGYKNVKWLTKVQATKFEVEFGTYQDQGFNDSGIINVNSRSTNVHEGTVVAPGAVEISGYAVSGYGPITNVDVRINNGAFAPAEIVPLSEITATETLPASIRQLAEATPYPYRAVWTKWRFRWNAPAGEHTVAVRATDSTGTAQPEVDDNIFDGQTGIARYNVTVR